MLTCTWLSIIRCEIELPNENEDRRFTHIPVIHSTANVRRKIETSLERQI